MPSLEETESCLEEAVLSSLRSKGSCAKKGKGGDMVSKKGQFWLREQKIKTSEKTQRFQVVLCGWGVNLE